MGAPFSVSVRAGHGAKAEIVEQLVWPDRGPVIRGAIATLGRLTMPDAHTMLEFSHLDSSIGDL